jgi:hypothetical protein
MLVRVVGTAYEIQTDNILNYDVDMYLKILLIGWSFLGVREDTGYTSLRGFL